MMHRSGILRRVLCACMALFWLGLCCPAQRDLMPGAYAMEAAQLLDISLSVEPAEMVAPGDVVLTFTIENTSGTDAQNVYLSSADGLLSEPIGQIPAGEKQSFNRPHSLTQAELDAGIIFYIISHDDPQDAGSKINYALEAQVLKCEARPQVEFTRQFSSEYVSAGNTLTITYRVYNSGNVGLNSIRVRDTLGDFTGRIEYLDVGESRTLISRVTISEASVSSATLSYCVDTLGETVMTQTLSDKTIGLAQAQIDAYLSAGYAAFSGNTAEVLLTLQSSGNVGYRDICISDDIYGGVIADNLRIEAGGLPLEISASYPLRGDEGFRWRVTGVSEAGDPIDFVTNTALLSPLDDANGPQLRVTAQAAMPLIDRPGNVRMYISIENSGRADAEDVVLREAALGELYTFAVLPAGSTTVREILVNVADDTSYVFTAAYADAEGWLHEAQSNAASVQIHPDGALPEGAKRSFIEFTGRSIKIGGSSLFAVLLISGFVVLVVLVIILLIATRRAHFEKKLRIAAEKQRRREELGKTTSFKPVKAPVQREKRPQERKAQEKKAPDKRAAEKRPPKHSEPEKQE